MLDTVANVAIAILSSQTVQAVVLVILAAAGGFFLYQKISRAQRRKAYPKDVVILHQIPPGLRAPSASPFVLKLETWFVLRLWLATGFFLFISILCRFL